MTINRRDFLKNFIKVGGLTILGGSMPLGAQEGDAMPFSEKLGVLVDTTYCVGCRSCEKACNEINDDLPRKNAEIFEDKSVFDKKRRMDFDAYTIVNRYNTDEKGSPVYVKFQCMHCNDPACVSACIVGAMSKEPNGAIKYDPWKCIGCRYCMTACPFQVPAYEYKNALDPQVRKCTFCFEKRTSKGELPACVQSCPMEVMTFGKREDLIKIARERIESNPKRYIKHIYGERELGGTSWMYISGVSFQDIGFPKFGYASAPGFTEPIQHAIFKYFVPPFALYGVLGGIMYYFKKKDEEKKREAALEAGQINESEEKKEG